MSYAAKYIACEPSSQTFAGLNRMKNDFNEHQECKDVQIIKSGSEIFVPEKESIDFCFTSPPYFNLELYRQ